MCTFVQNCLEDKCRFTPYDAPRPLGSGACCGARIALFEPGGHPQNSCNTGPNRSAANAACGSGLACDGGLPADAYPPDTPQSNVGVGLPAKAASQPTPIHLTPHNQTVGAGLPAKAASQPTPIHLTPHDPNVGAGLPAKAASQPTPIHLTTHNQTVGAGLLAKAVWQSAQLDCVHIHCCGNGRLGFRSDSGSLLKSAKVSKTLLPHHSAPRLGSVCP